MCEHDLPDLGIWTSARVGDLKRVQNLLEKRTDPNIQDEYGFTALIYASRANHVEIVKILLENGAHCNSTTWGGITALHRAAYMNNLEIIKLLIKQNANVNATDSDGETPLYKLCTGKHPSHEAILYLLESKADLFITDNKGILPQQREEVGAKMLVQIVNNDIIK